MSELLIICQVYRTILYQLRNRVDSEAICWGIIIRNNLYLQNVPDPDLLIRTGGFQRLSNFLLFQLSYTELFFTKTLWPDITKREIINIFNKFKLVERKYGL